ncbi:MAG: response regulator [Nitrospirae bacterium]|nr:response regulator [Nitrospirota bacterium]
MVTEIDIGLLKKEITVLCVEDELIIMESLRMVLRRRFDCIYMASNGEKGLELFKKHKIDIVITDILMPVMNGIEMARNILELKPATPIIALSAINDGPLMKQVMDVGIKHHIIKPFSDEEFFSVVYEAASEAYQRREQSTA